MALENVDLSQADLATVTTEKQRLDEFIHGLKAVEKQVIMVLQTLGNYLWLVSCDSVLLLLPHYEFLQPDASISGDRAVP